MVLLKTKTIYFFNYFQLGITIDCFISIERNHQKPFLYLLSSYSLRRIFIKHSFENILPFF